MRWRAFLFYTQDGLSLKSPLTASAQLTARRHFLRRQRWQCQPVCRRAKGSERTAVILKSTHPSWKRRKLYSIWYFVSRPSEAHFYCCKSIDCQTSCFGTPRILSFSRAVLAPRGLSRTHSCLSVEHRFLKEDTRDWSTYDVDLCCIDPAFVSIPMSNKHDDMI